MSIVLASIYLFLDPKKGSEVPLYIGQRDWYGKHGGQWMDSTDWSYAQSPKRDNAKEIIFSYVHVFRKTSGACSTRPTLPDSCYPNHEPSVSKLYVKKRRKGWKVRHSGGIRDCWTLRDARSSRSLGWKHILSYILCLTARAMDLHTSLWKPRNFLPRLEDQFVGTLLFVDNPASCVL